MKNEKNCELQEQKPAPSWQKKKWTSVPQLLKTGLVNNLSKLKCNVSPEPQQRDSALLTP